MRPAQTLFHTHTRYCIIQLAILSLLPAEYIGRTGMPGELERSLAYARWASIAVAGYGWLGGARILGLFRMSAGILEYLERFSSSQYLSIEDSAASSLAAFVGGLTRPSNASLIETRMFRPRLS